VQAKPKGQETLRLQKDAAILLITLCIVFGDHASVQSLKKPPLPVKAPDLVGDVVILWRDIAILLARNNLQNENPKCVGIGLPSGPEGQRILRRYVAPSACDIGDRAPVYDNHGNYTEVTKTGAEGRVDHDVACSDVTV
jgi:hypothetical protein